MGTQPGLAPREAHDQPWPAAHRTGRGRPPGHRGLPDPRGPPGAHRCRTRPRRPGPPPVLRRSPGAPAATADRGDGDDLCQSARTGQPAATRRGSLTEFLSSGRSRPVSQGVVVPARHRRPASPVWPATLVTVAWAVATLVVAPRQTPPAVVREVALFVHLGSVVLGFGAVL